jgi:hypothetical protein
MIRKFTETFPRHCSQVMIDFSCLNCGVLISCADDDAGDQIECPGCAIVLRVPTPIGGRLTKKRLSPPPAVVPVSIDTSAGDGTIENDPAAGARAQRPALPPEAPRFGFQIEYALIGVFGRDQQERLQASLTNICEGVREHLESRPQFFTSAGLVIEVHRFEVQIGSIDLRLHLLGSLNGENVSETILTHDSPGGSTRSILMRGFLGVAIANLWYAMLRTIMPGAGLARAYRHAERMAIKDLNRGLERIVK